MMETGQTNQEIRKVVDVHLHINFERPHSQEIAKKAGITYTPDGLLADMDASNVRKALIMSVPGQTKTSYEFAQRHPGRFWVCGSADPKNLTADVLKSVEADMAEDRIRALKFYIGYQHYYPDDEDCVPLYQLAIKYGLPVIFHTGDCVSPMARLRYSHPLTIDDLAFRFPDLKIVMAHIGNPWIWDAAEVIYKNENVCADLSGLITGLPAEYKEEYREWVRRQVQDAIYYCGADNMMFGTDYCLISHAEAIDFFSHLRIKREDLEKIFSRTALKLFGKGETI
ncbi:MAG: hypothetical protein C4520_03635 [Candidatus Abyssobacteria bacterium SURF_5]|uniref:Amidohydrolase-related domain-containing protein n=1 Tax=Abyssobacteria bacterium (strain SURF_5) TaxID=2093360 RepID=A0A3A4P9M3_ABYX5|nr:MAG: hypothetical protein C4520_03635 [Candidatus Abyssubacteria bacterium SURF_5]